MRSWKSTHIALLILYGYQSIGLSPLVAAADLRASVSRDQTLTSSDIIFAINKAHFLPAGSALRASVSKDQVVVSTYRHANADEKDCKIDAVLIAKSILDTAPDQVLRVSCCFFGKDLSSYQQVDVTAGDLKAFASGQMTNEQLLASLVVKPQTIQQQDDTDKISKQLENDSITHPSDYNIYQDKSNSVIVTTNLDPWVNDEESRLEALRIALNTFKAQPTAQIVKVNFTDPSYQSETREFDFPTEKLQTIWTSIQNAIAPIAVTKKPPQLDINTYQTVKGAEQEGRDALLSRLKEMDKKSIGIQNFVKPFIFIEQSVNRSIDPKYISEMVTKLQQNMDDQLKAYDAAQATKASIKSTGSKKTSADAALKQAGRPTRGETVTLSSLEEVQILKNPEKFASDYMQTHRNDPHDVWNKLGAAAACLAANGRAADSAKMKQHQSDVVPASLRK